MEVYIIKCKDPKHYYVGITSNLEKRLEAHKTGEGSRFIQVHGFDKLIHSESLENVKEAKYREKQLTLQYMKLFGFDNVAGAGFSQTIKNYKKNF